MSSEVWTESLLTLTALWLVNVIDENMKVNGPVANLVVRPSGRGTVH